MAEIHRRLFCLEESIWDRELGLSDRSSVLPMLELLERLALLDVFVHRHVSTLAELEHYLALQQRSRRKFGLIYLAFHGVPGEICLGEDESISLERLAHCLGSVPGAVIHLGACSTLRGQEQAAAQVLKATGAKAITGYDRNVEWLQSAVLDQLLIERLANYERPGQALASFERLYGELAQNLGWIRFPVR